MSTIRWSQSHSFGTEPSNFVIAPRAYHSATIVGHEMYIIGGTRGQSFFSDVRVIDLAGARRDYKIPRLIADKGTSQFSDVVVRGEGSKPFEGRSRHVAVAVWDARGKPSIYVFGGVHGGQDILRLSLGGVVEWQRVKAIGKKPPSLFSHCAVSITHKIYVFGGVDQQSQCAPHLWVFDTILSQWKRIDDAEGTPPPASPYYKMHAIGEHLLIVGNAAEGPRKRNFQDRVNVYMLNVQEGAAHRWCLLDTQGGQKIPRLHDMFETVALYDNADILQQGPVGKRLQIMLFDGALGASNKSKSGKSSGGASQSSSSASSSKATAADKDDAPRIWVLEFADDVETSVSDLMYSVVAVPGSQYTPSLRVGHTITALVSPTVTSVQDDGGRGRGGGGSADDPNSGSSAVYDEAFPKTPRVYVFGGSEYEANGKNASRYTADLHVGELPPHLVWQVQCNNIFEQTKRCIAGINERRARFHYSEFEAGAHSEEGNDSGEADDPSPSIGGAMVSFDISSSASSWNRARDDCPFSAAILVLGGLRVTREDMKKNKSPGAAMSNATGSAPARMMLLSVHDNQWDPTRITPTNVAGIDGHPGALALFAGGQHGLVHGLTMTVLGGEVAGGGGGSSGGGDDDDDDESTRSTDGATQNVIRIAIFGGVVTDGSAIPALSILEIDRSLLVSDPVSSVWGKWYPIEAGIPSRMGHVAVSSPKTSTLWVSGGWGRRTMQSATRRFLNDTFGIDFTFPTLAITPDTQTPTIETTSIKHKAPTAGRSGHSLTVLSPETYNILSHELTHKMKPNQFVSLMYGGVTKMGLSSDLILFTCSNTTSSDTGTCWLERLLCVGKHPGARFGHSACLLRDRDNKTLSTRLVIVGGSSRRGASGSDTESVWVLDLLTMAWSSPMYRRTVNLGLRQANLKNVLVNLIGEFDTLAQQFNLTLRNNSKLPLSKKNSKSKLSAKYLQKLKKVLNVGLLDHGGYISSTVRAYAPLAMFASEAGHDVCMALSSFDVVTLEKALKSSSVANGGSGGLFDESLEESELMPPLQPKSRFRGSAVEHPGGGILIFGGRAEDSADAWWMWRLMWAPAEVDPQDLDATALWRNRDRSDSFSSVYSTDDDSGSVRGSGSMSKSTGGSGSSDGGLFVTG